MFRQVRCECGIVERARSDDEVIALILSHVATNHPELAKAHTADYVRNWIELAPE